MIKKIISLDEKIEIIYMHINHDRNLNIDKVFVANDQLVRAGTVIGEMGKTGKVSGYTGPDHGTHLHFEAYVRDKRQNPVTFLKGER